MIRSRIALLFAIDAALLILLLVGLFGFRSMSDDRPLTQADLGSADSVTIVAGSAVTIVRTESGWDLALDDGRYPARADRIDPFLDAIESGRIIRDVTDDPALHADFELTEALARRVVIDAGVDLLFGSPGDRADTVYVRDPDETTVVLARAAVDFYLRQPASFWAYLRLFPEDVVAPRVVRVRLRVGGAGVPAGADPGYAGLELVRDEADRWLLTTDSGTVEASGVEALRFARDLADLVGDGFYEGSTAGLAPVVSVAFTVSDGREFSVEVLTDGELMIVNPDGASLPGDPYGGLRYTLAPEKLLRLIPRATTLAE